MKKDRNKIKFIVDADTENDQITKAAGIISIITLLSRVTGYFRDMIFASFFGAGMVSDAFIAAFRIPNLLRRLLGEGSLSLAFIPVFTHYIVKGEYDSGQSLAASASKLLFLCLLVISLVGVLLSPLIMSCITPGFTDVPQKMQLTVKLTQIMFSYIIFASMIALFMGILNVLGHFAAPAFAPILLNLSMVSSLLVGSYFYVNEECLAIGLAVGVLIGGFLQILLHLCILYNKGFFLWKKSGIWHPGLKKVGSIMLPTVFGSAVYQINILFGTILASFLEEGSVTYLYYADRIVQFPLGIFAYAFATAVFPTLSRQISKGDPTVVGKTIAHALNFLLFITLPASAGLVILRQPIVELLFGRGFFSVCSVISTSDALLYYALGLWAVSSVRVLVTVFFAFSDSATPAKAASFSIVFNLFLGAILMNPFGHCGLAIATSIASMLNLILLVAALVKKIDVIPWNSIVINVFKTLLCTVFMVISVVILKQFLIPESNKSGLYLGVGVLLCIIIGILVFFVAAVSMKMEQAKHIMVLGMKLKRRG